MSSPTPPPSLVRQVVCTGKGGVECLSFQTVPNERSPGEGELEVTMQFAGVAFADTMARSGMYPAIPPSPYVPGYDGVGVVVRTGPKCDAKPGDRVIMFMTGFGGYAEKIIVKEEFVAAIPSHVDAAEAACLSLNYLTAQHLLRDLAKVKKGETVVITSAAGGVGTAVLEMGRELGLNMIGTTSTGKLEIVTSRGAIAVDYKKGDFEEAIRRIAPNGVDVFIDNIGGPWVAKGYRLLGKSGRYINNGALDLAGSKSLLAFLGIFARMFLRKLIPDGRSTTFNSGLPPKMKADPAWFQPALAEIVALHAAGKLTPLIGKTFPLADAAAAQEFLESGKARGKILLDCRK